MKIDESAAIVTGGGSGMGAAVARHLAEQDCEVVIIDKSEAAVEIATELGGLAFPCDVSDGQALETAFAQIQNALSKPLRITVNCAGIGPAKRMVGKSGPAPLSWFEETIQVNLVGSFNVMRLAAACMMQTELVNQQRGIIINTASIAAFDGQIGQTAYSASKGGIVAMTLPAARELAPWGIRVLTIAPGLVDTPMLHNMSEEIVQKLQAQTIFPKRFGLPSEFAALVAHCIQNPFLNGETIRLDGAVRLN